MTINQWDKYKIAKNKFIGVGEGSWFPSLLLLQPLQYANPERVKATIDRGQKTGMVFVISDVIISTKETTGRAKWLIKKNKPLMH